MPSALGRSVAVLVVGAGVGVAATVAPTAWIESQTAQQFRARSAATAHPVLSSAAKQLNGLAVVSRRVSGGVSDEAVPPWLRSAGWSKTSLFGDVAIVEYLSEDQLHSVDGMERVMHGDTVGVANATTSKRVTVVRRFSETGKAALQVGTETEEFLSDLGLRGPAPTDAHPRLIWAPTATMLRAGLLTDPAASTSEHIETGAEHAPESTVDSGDFVVPNPSLQRNELTSNSDLQRQAAAGVIVTGVAVPVPGRGWLVAPIRPVANSTDGLQRIVKIGDSAGSKTVGGIDVREEKQPKRVAEFSQQWDSINLNVSVIGPWKFGVWRNTYPWPTGLAIGGITLVAALAVGIRRHRRNMGTYDNMLAAAHREARTDPLTGLNNRSGYLDAVRSTPPSHAVGVLLADLDRFKIVNDSRGHETGNLLLKAVADRLVELARSEPDVSCVARFGGDEFVLLVAAPPDLVNERAVRIADAMLRTIRRPFEIGPDTLVLGTSIGLAFGPTTDPETLLRDADIAMYAAKRAGGNRLAVADDELSRKGAGELDLEIGMRQALVNGEFIPWFQPIVDEFGNLHAFEALVRWQRGTGELVSPSAFLPAAKIAGLLGEVSTAMLSLVLPFVAIWNRSRLAAGLQALNVHVNCVEEQLCDVGFADVVASLLAHHHVDPSWIMLEVSEETALDRIPRGTPTLQALRAIGVRFSLDDFGFGNSSLTMLRELGDIAELKLDKSIVDDIAEQGIGADADVVDAILGFARRRDITIVAEGVEHQRQWTVLKGLGVKFFQGFLFSKPVPSAQASALVQSTVTGGADVDLFSVRDAYEVKI